MHGNSNIKKKIYTREIKESIVTAKAAFNKKKALFDSKLDLNPRKELVGCCNWNVACTVLKIGYFGK